MDDNATILASLNSDSAKQRERVINGLAPAALQDAQVLERLQHLVSSDPVEYVREAARAQLLAAGQTPRESVAPIQLKQEDATKPALFAIGFTGIVIVVCVLLTCALLALILIGTGTIPLG